MTTDTDIAQELRRLIALDLEAQQAIKAWEAHQKRIRGALQNHMQRAGHKRVEFDDVGAAFWQERQGTIDWEAALAAFRSAVTGPGGIIDHASKRRAQGDPADQVLEEVLDALDTLAESFDVEEHRKPAAEAFNVRPALKLPPAVDAAWQQSRRETLAEVLRIIPMQSDGTRNRAQAEVYEAIKALLVEAGGHGSEEADP